MIKRQQVCVLNCELLVKEEKEMIAASATAAAAADTQLVCSSNHHLDAFVTCSQFVMKTADALAVADNLIGATIRQFVPNIRSGSFADIGPRRSMEDDHLIIDDFGSLFTCSKPAAFYGVFDGHGGSDASAYVRNNVVRLLFQETDFVKSCQLDELLFLQALENCFRTVFLLADQALAQDCTISTSSGTTALTALVLGRLLLVANAGDCRAVLCRKGEAIDMSNDHRPTCPSEKRRVEEAGGFVDDEYLNGLLSVSRALGDWELKLATGTASSPLIADPELKQIILTEQDEFLIMGCDGIWDVMSSQKAVSIVRQGLRRHNDPQQCAKELVNEALRLNAYDNLTVVVVCFSSPSYKQEQAAVWRPRRFKFSLTSEAVSNLQNMLDG